MNSGQTGGCHWSQSFPLVHIPFRYSLQALRSLYPEGEVPLAGDCCREPAPALAFALALDLALPFPAPFPEGEPPLGVFVPFRLGLAEGSLLGLAFRFGLCGARSCGCAHGQSFPLWQAPYFMKARQSPGCCFVGSPPTPAAPKRCAKLCFKSAVFLSLSFSSR